MPIGRGTALLLWRGAVTTMLVLFSLAWGGGIASAHGIGGLKPSTSVAAVVSVNPPVPGLRVAVIEAGARLRIDNGSGGTVEVLPPPGVARASEPVLATGTTARWGDRRIAAAAAAGPPPDGRRDWVIPLRVDGRSVLVHGVQIWPEPPVAAWWWLATVVAAALSCLVGLAAVRRPRIRATVPCALIAVVMVGADLVHALGSALVVDDKPYLAAVFGAAGVALVAWPIGLAGAVMTAARHRFGPVVCGVAAMYIVLVNAFDVVGFSDAVLPFGWSPDLDRACTVLTLGASIGMLVAAFAALRVLGPILSSDMFLPEPDDQHP